MILQHTILDGSVVSGTNSSEVLNQRIMQAKFQIHTRDHKAGKNQPLTPGIPSILTK